MFASLSQTIKTLVKGGTSLTGGSTLVGANQSSRHTKETRLPRTRQSASSPRWSAFMGRRQELSRMTAVSLTSRLAWRCRLRHSTKRNSSFGLGPSRRGGLRPRTLSRFTSRTDTLRPRCAHHGRPHRHHRHHPLRSPLRCRQTLRLLLRRPLRRYFHRSTAKAA